MGQIEKEKKIQVVVVVDANILISSIIKSNSFSARLLTEGKKGIDFVSPAFILQEVKSKQTKICRSEKISSINFNNSLSLLTRNVLLLADNEISDLQFEKAYLLVKNIDIKDTLYIALTIVLDALFWTEDLKLCYGLRRKGFKNIMTTIEFKRIVKGL